MSTPTLDAIAQIVAMTVKAETATLRAEYAVLGERCASLQASLQALAPELTTLRERLVLVEVRPSIPGPAGEDGADAPAIDLTQFALELTDDGVALKYGDQVLDTKRWPGPRPVKAKTGTG